MTNAPAKSSLCYDASEGWVDPELHRHHYLDLIQPLGATQACVQRALDHARRLPPCPQRKALLEALAAQETAINQLDEFYEKVCVGIGGEVD